MLKLIQLQVNYHNKLCFDYTSFYLSYNKVKRRALNFKITTKLRKEF